MIDVNADESSNVIEVTIEGRVMKEDLDDLLQKLKQVGETRGELGLVEYIKSLEGVDTSIFGERMKELLGEVRALKRCAVVADAGWIKWVAKTVDPILSAEVKHFPTDELDAARTWAGHTA